MLNHGSLFSGIGGFDLAAEWMGWENIFHCEWNEFGQKILKHYFPKAISYADIKKTDFSIHRGNIDILTGGFPCQPYSTAGKRLGKADDRHLFPEMLRAIREIQPSYVVGENVSGIVNWGNGLVFDEVQTDLENEGYEVWAFILPAAAINAPHRRDRVWFIAYSNGARQANDTRANERKAEEVRRENKGNVSTKFSSDWNASDTNSFRGGNQNEWKRQRAEKQFTNSKTNFWEGFPTQSPICSRDDGLSDRLDNITFPKWRNESIKGFGNAIVPQVALQIFKAIEKLHLNHEQAPTRN